MDKNASAPALHRHYYGRAANPAHYDHSHPDPDGPRLVVTTADRAADRELCRVCGETYGAHDGRELHRFEGI